MIRRDKEAGQGRSTGTGQAAREYKQEGPRIKVLVHLTYVCRMRRAERSCPSQPANQAGDSQTTPFPYSCLLPPLHLALFLSRQHRRRGGEMESSEQGARAGGASARHGETTHSRADEVRGEGRGQQRGAMRQDCRSISVLARSPFALNPPTSCAPSATSNALLTRASIKTQTSLSTPQRLQAWHRVADATPCHAFMVCELTHHKAPQ
jgi:hypothetical protein